jgi:hypothetical protein
MFGRSAIAGSVPTWELPDSSDAVKALPVNFLES